MPDPVVPEVAPSPTGNSTTGGASHRDIRSLMDTFFEIERPQAPKVGTVGQEPRWPGDNKEDDGTPVVTKGAPLPEDDVLEEPTEGRVGGQTAKSPAGVADAVPPTQDPEKLGDDELDAIQLRPNVHPKTRGEFHQLKVKTKDYKDKYFAANKELETVKTEVAQLKASGANPADPTVQARLQKAEEIIRAARLPESREFQEKFAAPINQKWSRVVDDLAEILAKGGNREDPKLVEFRKQLLDLGPDSPALDKAWWNNQINALSDEDDKLDLRAQLREITVLRRERDRFVRDQGSDPERFQKFQEEEWGNFQKQYNQEVGEAVEQLSKELGVTEIAHPKDIAQAKNEEEKKQFEAHNVRFEEHKKIFQSVIDAIFAPEVDKDGVRRTLKHARVASMVVKAHHLEGVNKDLSSQLEAANKRVAALEAQVKRGAGAAARMERNGGAPTHKPQAAPQQTKGHTTQQRAANAMNDFMREKGVLRE